MSLSAFFILFKRFVLSKWVNYSGYILILVNLTYSKRQSMYNDNCYLFTSSEMITFVSVKNIL